jgi:hypothetical protein
MCPYIHVYARYIYAHLRGHACIQQTLEHEARLRSSRNRIRHRLWDDDDDCVFLQSADAVESLMLMYPPCYDYLYIDEFSFNRAREDSVSRFPLRHCQIVSSI